VLEGALSGTEGVCASHPSEASSGVCERCGDFLCAACSRFLDYRRYCERCVSRMREQSRERDRRVLVTVIGLLALVHLGPWLLLLLAAALESLFRPR
jgi:hypothetical protein